MNRRSFRARIKHLEEMTRQLPRPDHVNIAIQDGDKYFTQTMEPLDAEVGSHASIIIVRAKRRDSSPESNLARRNGGERAQAERGSI